MSIIMLVLVDFVDNIRCYLNIVTFFCNDLNDFLIEKYGNHSKVTFHYMRYCNWSAYLSGLLWS